MGNWKFYHWTPIKNLKRILKEGLKKGFYLKGLKGIPSRQSACVYLSTKRNLWRREGYVLLVVKLNGQFKLTDWPHWEKGDEVLCWQDIPPKYITQGK